MFQMASAVKPRVAADRFTAKLSFKHFMCHLSGLEECEQLEITISYKNIETRLMCLVPFFL